MLSFEEIKELIELVADRKLRKLELERSGFRISIVGRQRPTKGTPVVLATPETMAVSQPAATAQQAAERAGEGPDTETEILEATEPVESDDLRLVRSPIVGTFYAAPSPDAEPYVRVGDRVSKGQVLCIVEAMKLMNEIESDVNGVIVEVYGRNEQPVEYGEPLFGIRPG